MIHITHACVNHFKLKCRHGYVGWNGYVGWHGCIGWQIEWTLFLPSCSRFLMECHSLQGLPKNTLDWLPVPLNHAPSCPRCLKFLTSLFNLSPSSPFPSGNYTLHHCSFQNYCDAWYGQSILISSHNAVQIMQYISFFHLSAPLYS